VVVPAGVLCKLHRQGHLKVWLDLRRRLKGIMDPLPEVAVNKQLLA
jgi:hypothetical protein